MDASASSSSSRVVDDSIARGGRWRRGAERASKWRERDKSTGQP
jgi:hypothetical protein